MENGSGNERTNPDAYNKGDVITGLSEQAKTDSKVFHAGTEQQGDDIVTAGGRVLCACALGDDLAEAQRKAYELTQSITWDQVYYRSDIGFKALG